MAQRPDSNEFDADLAGFARSSRFRPDPMPGGCRYNESHSHATETNMDLGNVLGQILQQGMASQSRSRLEHAAGASGIGDLLGAVLGGQAGGRSGAGGLGDLLGSVLGGGRSGGGLGGAMGGGLGELLGGALGGGRASSGGGLGDLLGSVLGGQRGASASRGTGSNAGMALIATIAMAALKNWTDSRRAQAAFAAPTDDATQQAFESMTAPGTDALILRAMISAAKADGQVGEDEIERIVGRLAADGLSADEKRFLTEEFRRPLDLAGLVAEVPNPAVAAEVYAASLLAIDLDTQAELDYLRQLARALGLDGETVSRLHEITGATRV
ncbi:tellurite resistance TerB family protein [Thauera propionica]|uniref:tellurite resistance TerB family protein n=1 Tax=Thauera propionica TaxID=2019431 RepID=UPI0023F10944|nr:tellurite resistance TerB family protein [Thauera propionica]MDD3676411.1 tellurite resistance TerB family protein [Thauera propionica]